MNKEQIEQFNQIKKQIKLLEKEQSELADLFKAEVAKNNGDSLRVDDYTVAVRVGQQTRVAGHEKFKEILGQTEYQKMFELGLINVIPTATLKVEHEKA